VPAKTKERPMLRWIERLLLLVGLACLGFCAYAFLDARLTDRAVSRRLAAPAEPAPVVLSEGDPIGRLEIPRLGVSAAVLEGVADGTLRRGVGHIPQTPLPWQGGNVGLAGHRDSFFRPLKEVGKDDLITLTTPQGTYRYRVEWTRIVPPEELTVLAGDEPELTLVTCYPFHYLGAAPERFVVRARPSGFHGD
jgi:sortase A